jgi:hypothetical protein
LRFPGAKFKDFDDPSGHKKAETDRKSCRDILAEKGIYPQSGELTIKKRLEALSDRLSLLVKGQSAVVIDETECPMLTEGLKGGYRYQEIGQTGRYSEDPEKNQYSHPMDGQCYVASRLESIVDDDEGRIMRRSKPTGKAGY